MSRDKALFIVDKTSYYIAKSVNFGIYRALNAMNNPLTLLRSLHGNPDVKDPLASIFCVVTVLRLDVIDCGTVD